MNDTNKVVYEITDKLLKAGFVIRNLKKGNDGTQITAFGKDEFEVTVLVPPQTR